MKSSTSPCLPDRVFTVPAGLARTTAHFPILDIRSSASCFGVDHTMPRYITFLRAINVGGHTVKMDRLREIFESLGFANVETFIASGNVVFERRRETRPR